MHNRTLACFHCHSTQRKSSQLPAHASTEKREVVTCTHCGTTMVSLTDRWRVPAKNDHRGWKALETTLSQQNPHYRDLIAEARKTTPVAA